jgi:hypothetical protein
MASFLFKSKTRLQFCSITEARIRKLVAGSGAILSPVEFGK